MTGETAVLRARLHIAVDIVAEHRIVLPRDAVAREYGAVPVPEILPRLRRVASEAPILFQRGKDRVVCSFVAGGHFVTALIQEVGHHGLGDIDIPVSRVRDDGGYGRLQAKDIVEAAKKEAETVILNSKKDADEILGSVNRKVMKESLEFEMLQKKASEFRAHLIATYKEHLNLINQIPEYVEKEMEQTAPEAPKAKPEEKPAAPAEAVTEQPAPAQEPAPAAEPEVKEEAPAAAPAEEPEAAPEQFTLLDTDDEPEAAPAEMEDVSSSSEEETAEEAPEEDGFALDFSMIDDDDEDAAAEEPAAAPAHTYAKIEEDDEDDDDSAGSFKSLFKKK